MKAGAILQFQYSGQYLDELCTQKKCMLTAWCMLNTGIDRRTVLLAEAECLCRWLEDLHHCLDWIAQARAAIQEDHNKVTDFHLNEDQQKQSKSYL